MFKNYLIIVLFLIISSFKGNAFEAKKIKSLEEMSLYYGDSKESLINNVFRNFEGKNFGGKSLEEMGVYYGDSKENKIITSDDLYIVIHNPTKLAIRVMAAEAETFCSKDSVNKPKSLIHMQLLGAHTAYFSCAVNDKLSNYDLSKEEIDCIKGRVLESNACNEIKIKNSNIIKLLEDQINTENKFMSKKFIHLIKMKFYDEIEKYEIMAKKNYNQVIIDEEIKRKIYICNKYNDLANIPAAYEKCIMGFISNAN